MSARLVTYPDIEAAAQRLTGIARRTPVHTSSTFDERFGARFFFKCESFQRTGSFKFRGAYHALSLLSDEGKARGALTFSSGNHAQALALAGRLLDVPVTVVMPSDAPRVKQEATRGYGADIILYDRESATRETLAAEIADERGLSVIPPYDHPHIVAGQGTCARELLQEVDTLDLLLTGCGGGGLLSGSAIAANALQPACRVAGVEPANADDATRSFRTGALHTVRNPDTIADGARTPSLGATTFPLVRAHVDAMHTVREVSIVRAMHFLWRRMHLIVEPTGALAMAWLFEENRPPLPERIGVIVSGGNVEFSTAMRLFKAFGLE